MGDWGLDGAFDWREKTVKLQRSDQSLTFQARKVVKWKDLINDIEALILEDEGERALEMMKDLKRDIDDVIRQY